MAIKKVLLKEFALTHGIDKALIQLKRSADGKTELYI
jgi:hypothetical protein